MLDQRRGQCSLQCTAACQPAAAAAVFSKSAATPTFELLLKYPEPLCLTLRFAPSAQHPAWYCDASIDDRFTQLHSIQLASRDFSSAQRICGMQTAWCQVTRAGALHAPCRWQYGWCAQHPSGSSGASAVSSAAGSSVGHACRGMQHAGASGSCHRRRRCGGACICSCRTISCRHSHAFKDRQWRRGPRQRHCMGPTGASGHKLPRCPGVTMALVSNGSARGWLGHLASFIR